MNNDLRIEQETVFSRDLTTSGSIDLELAYDICDPVVGLTVSLPQAITIRRANGFAASGNSWVWDGGTAEPSLTGEYRTASDRSAGACYVDAGDWAIINTPSRTASWRYSGSSDPEFVERYRVDGPGAASPDGAVAFLGEHDRHHHRAAGRKFTLVVPTAADLVESPEDIFEAVSDAARHLDVSGYRGDVLMIAAPSDEAQWGPLGTQTGDSGFWALDNCRLDRPNTAWIHEYVHTQQAPEFDASMDWFTEGTTCYYATWCSMHHGEVSFDTGRGFLETRSDRDATLTRPETWPSQQTKYTKGRRVLAALDCEIRKRTNDADVRDVWRHLNETYDAAGYDEFLAALNAVLPRETGLDLWAAKYIDGTAVPSLPDAPAAFGLDTELGDPEREPVSPESGTDDGPAGDVGPECTGPDPETGEPESKPEKAESEEPDRDSEPGEEEGTESESESEGHPECPVCGSKVDSDAAYCDHCGVEVGRTCHVCGTDAPGQRYCPECGTELVATCDVCGTQQSGDAEYCHKCGTRL